MSDFNGLQIGDKVRLSSGGPTMTVTNLSYRIFLRTPYATCVWFDSTNRKHEEDFNPGILVKVD